VAGGIAAVLAGAVYADGAHRPGPLAGGRAGGQAGGHADTSSPGPAAPGTSSKTSPPAAGRTAELQDVVSAYRRFWAVAQGVDRQPPEQWRPLLTQVTGPPLLDQLLDGFAAARTHGTLQYGTVEVRPDVVDLTTARASILDCQDASQSGELDRDTGTIEKTGSARTPVAAVVSRQSTGRWVVTEARYLPGSC
jgi:hypothetical protein